MSIRLKNKNVKQYPKEWENLFSSESIHNVHVIHEEIIGYLSRYFPNKVKYSQTKIRLIAASQKNIKGDYEWNGRLAIYVGNYKRIEFDHKRYPSAIKKLKEKTETGKIRMYVQSKNPAIRFSRKYISDRL